MSEVTGRRLASNSLFAVIEQVWRIGSRIIITPMIIHRLGMDGYGVWTLLFTICAYVNAVDANFGVAYNKLAAEHDAHRDYARLSQILGAGMTLVGLIALVALSGIWLARMPILRFFSVPEPMLVDAGWALLVVSACVVLRMSVGCAFPVLQGLQRTDLRNVLSIAASAIEFVVSIVLLLRGWKLLGLAMGHMCGQVTTTIAAWVLCKRLRPELSFNPLHSTAWGFRQIISMGGRFQFLSVMQLLIHKGTKLFTASVLGTFYLGIVEVAEKLITLGVAVGGGLLTPVMPAFSNLQARGDARRVQVLFERGSKMMAAVCLPCFAFLAIFAPRLIVLWTGESFPLAAWTVRMIAPVAYLSMLTGMGTAALRAQGNIRVELFYALIGAIILVALYYPGYLWHGYHGMIGVEVVAGVISAAWFLYAFGRRQKLDLRGYLWGVLARPVIVMGPLIAIAIIAAPHTHLTPIFEKVRLNLLVEMTLVGAVFGVLAAGCAWFGMFNIGDRDSLRNIIALRRGAAKGVGPA
ncbi:MAG: oligosaccharide flippase family protein [Phycisphaerales bacterium]|nr:oligosaccharide flippase family protein [Phycisphaerales bacterium]